MAMLINSGFRVKPGMTIRYTFLFCYEWIPAFAGMTKGGSVICQRFLIFWAGSFSLVRVGVVTFLLLVSI